MPAAYSPKAIPLAAGARPIGSELIEVLTDQQLLDALNPEKPPKKVKAPYAEQISAGKNTYVYDAHTYHTKVPPQGIARVIEHYTRPGDVVLDPFCGSGMTGVAALELGRVAILSDLSPAAAFIAENLATPIDHGAYLEAVEQVLNQSHELEKTLYGTQCRKCGKAAISLYTVWSYGLVCNYCDEEFLLWDAARFEGKTVRESKIKKEFDCPHCGRAVAKRGLRRTRRYPVQIGYDCCARGLQESMDAPSKHDLNLLKRIEKQGIPKDLWYPTDPFPVGVNTRQPIAAGIKTVDQAYTTRALYAMAQLWKIAQEWPNEQIRKKLLFTITSLYRRVTVFSEFRFWGGSGNTANLNVPQIMNEQNVFRAFGRKASTISWYFRDAPKLHRRLNVSVRPASTLAHLPDKSVDYVFTDPPFGGNINYSEMNFLWESWLGQRTDVSKEAIINAVQGKTAEDYRDLLGEAFKEVGRVLKKNGWLTVVFHNSSQKVWSALQGAIADAGFVVVGTQTFDKKHGTFKMFVSDNSVGYDLVLHCRRQSELKGDLLVSAGHADEVNALSFIRQKLEADNAYMVRFLHVKRADEFDYRKLYAEWLSAAVSSQIIGVDFEHFRELVDTVRSERNKNG